jgi:large subunit ribosomal protein L9
MEIILLERIEHLGQMGDVVQVKNGYARNYLLPKGKALRATKNNLERFEHHRVELEARNLEQREDAEAVAAKMDGTKVVLVRQASDMGQLYGSVSARDIAEMLAEAGFQVARPQVVLDRPIKTLGIHPVRISLHPEVSVTVDCNVARSEAEAQQQEAGIFFDSPELAEEAEEEAEEAQVELEEILEQDGGAEAAAADENADKPEG